MTVSSTPFVLRITEGLHTEVLGRKEIRHFRETDSTNARAVELAEEGAPEGTLVVADRQTRGRGRRGNTWFSPPEAGIYASMVLRPSASPGDATQITFLTAVAASEALISTTALDVRIKWPNDLLVKGRKIAGILTEMHAARGAVEYAVVGLGINVNTPGFPDELRDTATSIRIETGKSFSRDVILREYLHRQEQRLRQWQTSGFDPILRRWRELGDTIGRHIRVDMGDKTYEGWAEDVDSQGALLLKAPNGESHRIITGHVLLL